MTTRRDITVDDVLTALEDAVEVHGQVVYTYAIRIRSAAVSAPYWNIDHMRHILTLEIP